MVDAIRYVITLQEALTVVVMLVTNYMWMEKTAQVKYFYTNIGLM